MKYFIIVWFIVCLPGCATYKLKEFDIKNNKLNITEDIDTKKSISIRYIKSDNIFKAMTGIKYVNNSLNISLEKEGFNSVTEGGIVKNGYSMDFQSIINSKKTNINASGLLYFISAGILPSFNDVYLDVNITYYKDGVIINNVTYQSKFGVYVSFLPTALILGDLSSVVIKEYTAKLAKKIIVDYSFKNQIDTGLRYKPA